MRISTKDIPWYELKYSAFTDGRIWSYPKRKKPWLFLKLIYDKKGYQRVCLINKWRKIVQVHRMIALTFIPNPENKPQVNHKNWMRDDNRIENLEWVTAKENVLHSFRLLWKKPNTKHLAQYRGYNSKWIIRMSLNWEYIDKFTSAHRAARELWFNQWNICECLLWRRKTHKWFLWKYDNHIFEHTHWIHKLDEYN